MTKESLLGHGSQQERGRQVFLLEASKAHASPRCMVWIFVADWDSSVSGVQVTVLDTGQFGVPQTPVPGGLAIKELQFNG